MNGRWLNVFSLIKKDPLNTDDNPFAKTPFLRNLTGLVGNSVIDSSTTVVFTFSSSVVIFSLNLLATFIFECFYFLK
jgi:hypothetical protein